MKIVLIFLFHETFAKAGFLSGLCGVCEKSPHKISDYAGKLKGYKMTMPAIFENGDF